MELKRPPTDPAEVMKKLYRFQSPETNEPGRYVMSPRNQERMEKLERLVKQMRGAR